MKNNFLLLLNFGPISTENVTKTYEINRNVKQIKEFNEVIKTPLIWAEELLEGRMCPFITSILH